MLDNFINSSLSKVSYSSLDDATALINDFSVCISSPLTIFATVKDFNIPFFWSTCVKGWLLSILINIMYFDLTVTIYDI